MCSLRITPGTASGFASPGPPVSETTILWVVQRQYPGAIGSRAEPPQVGQGIDAECKRSGAGETRNGAPLVRDMIPGHRPALPDRTTTAPANRSVRRSCVAESRSRGDGARQARRSSGPSAWPGRRRRTSACRTFRMATEHGYAQPPTALMGAQYAGALVSQSLEPRL